MNFEAEFVEGQPSSEFRRSADFDGRVFRGDWRYTLLMHLFLVDGRHLEWWRVIVDLLVNVGKKEGRISFTERLSISNFSSFS